MYQLTIDTIRLMLNIRHWMLVGILLFSTVQVQAQVVQDSGTTTVPTQLPTIYVSRSDSSRLGTVGSVNAIGSSLHEVPGVKKISSNGFNIQLRGTQIDEPTAFRSVNGDVVRFEVPEKARLSSSPTCGALIPSIEESTSRMPGCPAVVPCDDPVNRDASIPDPADPIKYFKLRWTVINSGDVSENIDQQRIDDLTAEVNADFSAYRIQFCSDPGIQVTDVAYYNLDAGDEDSGLKSTYGADFGDVINIYVVNDISNPNAGGYARFPYDPFGGTDDRGGVVLGRTNATVGTHTLAHELGHTFGLHHTFHGVDEVLECSSCYEQVGAADGSPAVGDTDGDLCSDTNPHPTNAFNCNDPAGPANACDSDPWANTPVDNHMSYSFCSSAFTLQQAGRMHCMIDTYLDSWVQYGGVTCGSAPPIAEFSGSPTYWQAPANVTFTDGSIPEGVITNWTWTFTGGTPATWNGQTPPPILYDTPGDYSVGLNVSGPNGTASQFKSMYIHIVAPSGECDTLDGQWNSPTPTVNVLQFGPDDLVTGVPSPTHNGGPGPGTLGMYERYITPTPGTSQVGAVRVLLGALIDSDDDMQVQVGIYDDNAGQPDIVSPPLTTSLIYSPTAIGIPTNNGYVELWIPFQTPAVIPSSNFHVGIVMIQGDADDRLILFGSSEGQGEGNGRNHVATSGTGVVNYYSSATLPQIDIDLHLIPMLGEYTPLPLIEGYLESVYCDSTQVVMSDTVYYSTPVSWEFQYNDGESATFTTDPMTLETTYDHAGPDTVSITAVNSCGRSRQTDWVIPYHFDETPVADFDKDVMNPLCASGTPVNFTAATSGLADYEWQFGDGASTNTGALNATSHPYPAVGEYHVTLTATGPGYQPSSTIFSEDFDTGMPPTFLLENVDAQSSVYPIFSTNAWVALDIDGDGDGEAVSTSLYSTPGMSDDWMITPAIALGANTSLYWDAQAIDPAAPDGYQVYISTTTQTVAACLPDLLLDIPAENPWLTHRMLNLASLGYADQTVYVAFRNNSNGQNLLSIDDIVVGETFLACPSTEQKLDFVETVDCSVQPPTAHFVVDLSGGCVPSTFTFTDESTGVDPATSWLWDFGDGGFSTVQDPIHTYSLPGYFEVTMIAYNAGGSDTARVFLDIVNCTVLPIDLLYYTGERMGDYNQLDWSTASEFDSDHYDLYRINEKGEQLITTLPAAVNSSQETVYGWKDHDPPALVNYYRLDQTDMDGTLSFSQTIVIDNSDGRASSAIRIAPNPARDEVHITVDPHAIESIRIVDAIGNVVYSKEIFGLAESGIDVSTWAQGMYSVVAYGSGILDVERIVVRR